MSVLVYMEVIGGELKKASLEALGIGRELAGELGGSAHAVAVADDPGGVLDTVKAHGADTIYTVEGSDHANYIPEAHLAAVVEAADRSGAQAVLIPATARGRDLAPRVAAKLNVAFIPEVTGLELEDGQIKAVRPEFAGKVYRTVKTTALPVVISTRPNTFDASRADGAGAREQLEISFEPKAKVVETRKAGGEKLDVAEADIIVSGGRGLKEPENFKIVEELADTLGAAVGASRAVVDAGWRPHAEQVGQTGKTVSPTLYIAVGISGAVQHLAGMRTAKTIVAINKDPDAPIFKVADYGLVGDALAVVPKLTEKLKK
ncbi:MAG: Caffeyl-CoA reductase-Etf complex subunit CarE [Calditrichaeota bacterium]|nr:Caffeyl-CoA reductase-Etf complex subunit CarE [Calditrichota bacterium]